jgi:hypothetical protein
MKAPGSGSVVPGELGHPSDGSRPVERSEVPREAHTISRVRRLEEFDTARCDPRYISATKERESIVIP